MYLVIYSSCYRSYHPEFIKASTHPLYSDKKMHDLHDLTLVIGVLYHGDAYASES